MAAQGSPIGWRALLLLAVVAINLMPFGSCSGSLCVSARERNRILNNLLSVRVKADGLQPWMSSHFSGRPEQIGWIGRRNADRRAEMEEEEEVNWLAICLSSGMAGWLVASRGLALSAQRDDSAGPGWGD